MRLEASKLDDRPHHQVVLNDVFPGHVFAYNDCHSATGTTIANGLVGEPRLDHRGVRSFKAIAGCHGIETVCGLAFKLACAKKHDSTAGHAWRTSLHWLAGAS